MSDLISRDYAIIMIKNQIVLKEPDESDPLFIEAYKAGFRHALMQAELELKKCPKIERECDKHG